jgi:hypothetical protein
MAPKEVARSNFKQQNACQLLDRVPLQILILCGFVLLCPSTLFMTQVLTHAALYLCLSSHIIRKCPLF